VTFWRISDYPNLDGAGGLRVHGRWHLLGQRTVYCAPNPATALVETLVHIELELDDLPDRLQYLEVEAPEAIFVETVDLLALGPMWQSNLDATQSAGAEWLRSGRTALLRVPSVIVPATWNILINPSHAESAQIRIVRIHAQGIDSRLLR